MIRKLIRGFLKVAWFLPGFLLWAAFPPMGEKTDVLFALAPLLWLMRRSDAKTSAKRWFQAGAFYWVATLMWMPAIVKNGGPWPLVALGWFALAAYCAAYFAAFGWLGAKFWAWAREGGYGRRLLGVLVVEPLVWCGLELVRSRFMGGFAWNQLGVVAVNAGFGGPAALGGVYLCSAVVILINGTIAGIAERMWRPELSGFANMRRFGTLETLLAFGLVTGLYSQVRWNWRDAGDGRRSVKVAMVQRNFPCCFSAPEEESPVDAYSNLLVQVSHLAPDLVVLSESATCEFGAIDGENSVRFAAWARRLADARAVLAGGSRRADGHEYNSAALYTDAAAPQVYDKVHLVPFGEYIPGDKVITVLQKLAPVGSCTAGELKTLDFDGIPLGVAICYEDTDSAQMRALARKGAQALVFITNDSWFSHSVEAEQHAWQAVARAVETGLPVIRTGNGGVTGTVSPSGATAWLTGSDGRPLVDRRGTMCDRVTVCGGDVSTRTPYVVLGDWPLGIAFALFIAALILVKYRNEYEKRRYLSM